LKELFLKKYEKSVIAFKVRRELKIEVSYIQYQIKSSPTFENLVLKLTTEDFNYYKLITVDQIGIWIDMTFYKKYCGNEKQRKLEKTEKCEFPVLIKWEDIEQMYLPNNIEVKGHEYCCELLENVDDIGIYLYDCDNVPIDKKGIESQEYKKWVEYSAVKYQGKQYLFDSKTKNEIKHPDLPTYIYGLEQYDHECIEQSLTREEIEELAKKYNLCKE
jgi:hypothetical protein